jgi:hypothetical protein
VVFVGVLLAVPLLRHGPLRGWALVSVYALVFLAAGALPTPIGHYGRLGLIVAYPILIFGFQEVLLGQTFSESAFERELFELMTSLADPMRAWRGAADDDRTAARQRVAQASAAALARWRSLSTPSARWQDTHRLAGEYLDAVGTASTRPGPAGEIASERADELVALYEAAWRRATGRGS